MKILKSDRNLLKVISDLGYGVVSLFIHNGSFSMSEAKINAHVDLTKAEWISPEVSGKGTPSKEQIRLLKKIKEFKEDTTMTIKVSGGKPVTIDFEQKYRD